MIKVYEITNEFLEEVNVLNTMFDGLLEYDDFKRVAKVACKTRTEANSNDPKISTIISTRKLFFLPPPEIKKCKFSCGISKTVKCYGFNSV